MPSTASYSNVPLCCCRCGTMLRNHWFDFGNGQYLCGLCYSDRYLPQPTTITFQPIVPLLPLEQPNKTAEWIQEVFRLNAELNKANERIAELEAKLKAIDAIVNEPDNRPGETAQE